MKSNVDRREFAKSISTAIAALSTASLNLSAAPKAAPPPARLSVHLFSKMIQFLDYKDMSAAAADMGFDGLDLTVRPGGHVEPAKVQTDLPRAVNAMKRHGLSARLMTTAITDIETLNARATLSVAASQGIEAYRTGWYRYDEPIDWKANLDRIRNKLTEIEAVNKELGIHGGYQNHSGNFVGALTSDIAYLLHGSDPDWLGCQFDIRHATVEGGLAWPLALKILRNNIRTIIIKDFKWVEKNGRQVVVNTPMGEGVVQFKSYFKMLRELNLNPIISFHAEYLPSWKKVKPAQHEGIFAELKSDLQTFHRVWQESTEA